MSNLYVILSILVQGLSVGCYRGGDGGNSAKIKNSEIHIGSCWVIHMNYKLCGCVYVSQVRFVTQENEYNG